VTTEVGAAVVAPTPTRLKRRWIAAGVAAVLAAMLLNIAIGQVALNPAKVGVEVLNDLLSNLAALVHLKPPGTRILDSGLEARQAAIVTQLRLPRAVLGLLVGALLSVAGGCYQGVFRNPLADPYLLGVAAGAGLGATSAIVVRHSLSGEESTVGTTWLVPLAAFAGGMLAVALTYLLGLAGGRDRSPATLILAGVAISAFLTAAQTYILQRNVETIREVYSWILGRVATSGWHDVRLLLPYFALTTTVILLYRRELDVLTVGDEEATGLGLHPQRTRIILVIVASLGAAAAVAVSGLIGFVGIIVPHTVRLIFGSSYRVVLPLSMLFGAAFLALADLAARTLLPPTEIPIGVVTAFFGAPFFVLVLRTAAGRRAL
jgi:iron complex transport system permease protein